MLGYCKLLSPPLSNKVSERFKHLSVPQIWDQVPSKLLIMGTKFWTSIPRAVAPFFFFLLFCGETILGPLTHFLGMKESILGCKRWFFLFLFFFDFFFWFFCVCLLSLFSVVRFCFILSHQETVTHFCSLFFFFLCDPRLRLLSKFFFHSNLFQLIQQWFFFFFSFPTISTPQ